MDLLLYPFNVFPNLSGISWMTAHMDWWYHAIYTPWFGVSINLHPNYFRQAVLHSRWSLR